MLLQIDIHRILADVDIGRDGTIHVGKMGDGFYLQHQYQGTCSITGKARHCKGRKWYVSSHSCKSEIVQTALKAVITNAEHEAREKFKYRGKAIFGPHLNVDKLLEFCDTDHIEERDNGPK